MKRFLRYLRIAFSATCLIACVLLIALCVRSFRQQETVYGDIASYRVVAASHRDSFLFVAYSIPPGFQPAVWRYKQETPIYFSQRITWFNFAIRTNPATLAFPQWLLILLAATSAAAPWIRWSKQFSLRTLLIATTLVAVVLGWIVAVLR